jgi:hypothetical protein
MEAFPLRFGPLSGDHQAKHLIRVITPDEYDKAVRRDPRSCPLAAMGDLRSGRQLLADGAGDWYRSFASMAATPDGRAEQDYLASLVEGMRL